jgi:RNA polymerase sigma factor (sigma-70 family)
LSFRALPFSSLCPSPSSRNNPTAAENHIPRGVYTFEMTAGDLAALIDAHAAALVLYARQFCRSPEDAVQAAFGKLACLAKPPDHPKAWLFTVVRRLALDARKQERRRKRREEAVAKPDGWFQPAADGEEVAVALQGLPEDQREVIVMRLWGDLTLEQVAEACGCSVSTAHRRYEAGISALRERMDSP